MATQVLDSAAVEQLDGTIKGEVLTPDRPGYDEARTVFNAMVDKRPAAVVRCKDPHDVIADWPDARVWEELHQRFGFALHEGPVVDRLLSPMRSFVVEPMRYGRLFLAGDSAHIVPPTGAKGMNLAVADVRMLSRALAALLQGGRTDLVESYSDTCLRRVWRAEHFSYFMTTMLHRAPGADPFQQRLQLSQLRYTVSSTAAATSLAENYVGLPFA